MSRPPRHGRLWARWGLDPVAGLIDGVRAEWINGRWTSVRKTARPPADFKPHECHDAALLTPGLLNAHAHLDYSMLKGRLPGGAGFVPWLRAMIATRGELDPSRARAAAAEALAETLADGLTELWDIQSFGWGRRALAAWERGRPARQLKTIHFLEFIAPSHAGWEAAWAAWRRAAPARARGVEAAGISPHAPYSVCPPAMAAAGAWARGRGWPLAIHLAESPEEEELLTTGRGPLAILLSALAGADRAAELGVGPAAIERAATAGLLGPATLAIHCNLPRAGDARRLADSGAVVVYCPASHAFFGYPPYPLARYRRAGVRLALGSDSLASNASLSIRREARVACARHRGLDPLEALALATGAALGTTAPFGGRGRLVAGAPADWALWRPADRPRRPIARSLAAAWLDPTTVCTASSARPGT